jgi:hypothetical protein
MLTQALGRLIAVAEAYPDLKANQNFMALQAELTSTEDRIASARRYYNANVRELNTKVESVPSNIVAACSTSAGPSTSRPSVSSASRSTSGARPQGIDFGQLREPPSSPRA